MTLGNKDGDVLVNTVSVLPSVISFIPSIAVSGQWHDHPRFTVGKFEIPEAATCPNSTATKWQSCASTLCLPSSHGLSSPHWSLGMSQEAPITVLVGAGALSTTAKRRGEF